MGAQVLVTSDGSPRGVDRMRETRLILVDGVPRSGKSTIAEHVTRELEQRGIPCRLLREREPDPLGPA
jgi:thymidylate kinase